VRALSWLTWSEQAEVIATHFAVNNKNFRCSDCKLRHSETKRNKFKGCSGPLDKPVAKYKDQINFYKCPTNYYSSYVVELMPMARQLENGLLPYSGGLMDQPSKLIDLLSLINSLRLEDEIERLEKQTKEAKKWQKTKSKYR
jgi:hypothetical protein